MTHRGLFQPLTFCDSVDQSGLKKNNLVIEQLILCMEKALKLVFCGRTEVLQIKWKYSVIH